MLLNNDVATIEKILAAYQQSTVYKFTEEIKKKTQEALNSGQTGMELNGTYSGKLDSDRQIITI
jgi:ABC-type xylose transport system substrate-binding protein